MAQGRLSARLAYVNGRTRMVECQQSAPLKIARTFEAENGGLDICIMDASPGLLAGDDYQMDWRVEEGARVRITTQGATRVHPAQGRSSRQTTRVLVAAESRLEMWPETIIPFAGADFISTTELFLEEGAQLVLFESVSAGRVARNEAFAFKSLDSRVVVRDRRGPLLYTRNRFVPDEFSPQNPFSWGGAMQWSCLYMFGSFAAPELEKANHVLRKYEVQGSTSLLAHNGMTVAMLGQRAHDLRCVALEIKETVAV